MENFKELLIETIDVQEDKEVLKKFKKLLNETFKYADENLQSDFGQGPLYSILEEAIEYTDKLKGK